MFGFLRRWRARRRLGQSVDIWYHPEYAPPALAETARASALEIDRGVKILAALEHEGLVAPDDVRRPRAATVAELLRFHTLPYLESTNDPAAVARVFGLEPSMVDVTSVVRASVRATGGTLEASRDVIANRGKWAFNLGGGYHHGRADLGAGFCVHNDVAVAIANLRAEGFDGRVLIVDLDFHQGDAYIEAYADDPSVLVYSIHGSVWTHIQTRHHQHHLTGRVGDRRYLSCLRSTLPAALQVHQPDLVYYVAGNDVLAGDALGAFDLTLQGVLDRDRFVLDAIQLRGTPLVTTPAGGYSRDAWRATYAMIRYALSGRAEVSVPRHYSIRGHFSEVAAGLDPVELQRDDKNPFALTEEDLMGGLLGKPRGERFLDYYSAHGIEVALTRYGFFEAMAQRGYTQHQLELDVSDRARQIMRIRGTKNGRTDHLLMELVVRRLWIPDPGKPEGMAEVLSIEWMLMQDPTADFTLKRPPLPGQKHPGFGVALQVQEVLVQVVLRLGLQGLMRRPAYFHTAMGGHGEAVFIDPIEEGQFRAMKVELRAPVDEVSRAIDERRVVWGDGEALVWPAGRQIVPLGDRLTEWFSSAAYRDAVAEAQAKALQRGIHMDLAKAPLQSAAVDS